MPRKSSLLPGLMTAVGYWVEVPPGPVPLPDPQVLVDPGWLPDDRPRVCEYLRAGHTWVHWRGVSFCRIGGCGVGSNGSRCLTDGEFVWPEGLAHYVERHAVRLPDWFVGRMREHGWRVPPWDPTDTDPDRLTTDEFARWVAWASSVTGS